MGVISLAQAKKYLHIDTAFTEDDNDINRFIDTAEQWVEQYTCYVLSPRVMTLGAGFHDVYKFPINSVSNPTYLVCSSSLSSTYNVPFGHSLALNVGYTSSSDVPPLLLSAVLKIVQYLYDNRDMYEAGLPTDVQILLNQFRRGLFVV